MDKTSKIFVAGIKVWLVLPIVRKLQSLGFTNIITQDKRKLNLINTLDVDNFFGLHKPEYVFLGRLK
jgi:GDP-L-fucose synthase